MQNKAMEQNENAETTKQSLIQRKKDQNDEKRDFGTINKDAEEKEKTGSVKKSSKGDEYVAYKRRYYILLLFVLFAMTQGLVWNTWGPISESAQYVFGWHMWDLALLPNWACLAAVICTFPLSWLMEEKGLRITMIVSSSLIAIGTGLRCITSDSPAASWLIHACAILNGVAGPVASSAPPVISAVWFPSHERTTATAITSICMYIGFSMAYILGPLMVSYEVDFPERKSFIENASAIEVNISQILNKSGIYSETTFFDKQKQSIMYLMYVEFGIAILIAIAIIIYFPAKPPTPPSLSAALERTDFVDGLCEMMLNGNIWLVTLPYAIPAGFYIGWGSVLDLILSPMGIDQMTAGWIGFYSTMGGCVTGLLCGRVSDFFPGHMKLSIIIQFCASAAMFVWLCLMTTGFVRVSVVMLYISIVFGGSLLNGTVPLFLELCCETGYPIAEATLSGLLTLLTNFFGSVILFMFWVPDIGTNWSNWLLLVALIISIVLMGLYKEEYRRQELDELNAEKNIETEEQ